MEECEPRQCSGHELLSPALYKDLMSYIAIASGGFVWHLGLACSEYGVSLAMLRYHFNGLDFREQADDSILEQLRCLGYRIPGRAVDIYKADPS